MSVNNYSLDQWLAWISSFQAQEIVLGLERVRTVAQRLSFRAPPCPVIVVGGTNGKGSCVAALEKIYSEQGYRTGVFTSPILFRHNELLRIQGKEVADEFFCAAYQKIEVLRAGLPLTPFEYHTLAVLEMLQQHPLDVWILEVGLGGRLDAVNVVDADVAVVTSIALDHTEWLGKTRTAIGREKAGIFRAGRPALCGDPDPPSSLRSEAEKKGAPFFCQGKDFQYTQEAQTWRWQGRTTAYSDLPFSSLALQNISSALMAVECLQPRLPVSSAALQRGIKNVSLPGRIEIKPGPHLEIHDVAHNPAAVAHLAACLKNFSREGKTQAVFSMLGDKDLCGSLGEIKNQVDVWHVAPLAVQRGARMQQLRTAFKEEKISRVCFYDSIQAAYKAARASAQEGDCLLVFGSFHVLASLAGE